MPTINPYLCSVIIPTLNAADLLPTLLNSLCCQHLSRFAIIVIDSGSEDRTVDIALSAGCCVHRIRKQDFNHGGTRNFGVFLAKGEIVVFMTQDTILSDAKALQNIIRPFSDPKVGAVCGRQLPRKGANPLGAHARYFNYPSTSSTKTKADIPNMGIKVPFISNSFAAYKKSVFNKLSGFPDDVIFGEDMCLAAKMVLSGYSIAYSGDACVYHSHNYTPIQEFQRYFDIGVLHARKSWIQESFGGPGDEGLRYIISELVYAHKHSWYWVIRSLVSCIAKFLGYKLGKMESGLPIRYKLWLSMNKNFWSNMKRF